MNMYTNTTLTRIISICISLQVITGFASDSRKIIADAGPNISIVLGETAVLDGSASKSTSGTPLRYSWKQVTRPDDITALSRFECPVDWSERYATRVSGYLHPPVSGAYTFWIASDDGSELYLGTGRDPAGKKKIAEVTDWTDNGEWDKFPSQKSAPLTLEKGKTYYIEALQLEASGGDNLAVAWQYPGRKRTVIDGRFLSPTGNKDKTGSITREVWHNVNSSTITDFMNGPRVARISDKHISGSRKSKARFTPDTGGIYLFELQVGDGKEIDTDQVLIHVTSSLENGNFESGSGAAPEHWKTGSRENADSIFTWEKDGGIGNSRCVSITVTNPAGADAWWTQTVQLAPHTAYIMKGYVKGDTIHIVPREIRGNGANISVRNLWKCSSNRETTTGSFNWTEFIIDFQTGESGLAEVSGRIGYADNKAAGKAWFDNISVEPNLHTARFTSKHFVLNLYTNHVALATTAGVQQVMANLDWLYEGYSNLSGAVPFGGCTVSAWFPQRWNIQAGGWSGNPVLWSGDPFTNWAQKGYIPAVFLHEFGHDFDNGLWSFHGEFFAEFFRYYGRDALNMYNAEEPKHWKSAERWKKIYDREWIGQEWASIGALLYKFAMIKDVIGWEPFEKMFRSFHALEYKDRPKTKIAKLNMFIDKLSEHAGTNVWNFFSHNEKDMVNYAFDPPKQPEPKVLADIDPSVKTFSLSDAKWDEAIVGWGKPERNRLEDGRPLMSGKRKHDKWLYAHACSKYTFSLGKKWKELKGIYAMQADARGTVVFVIKGDGRELLRSDLVNDDTEHPFSVDLSGIDRLDLIVEDGGNHIHGDSAMWFAPELSR